MQSDKLPSTLSGYGALSAISMERALNQIKSLLETLDGETPEMADKIEASLDDIDLMLHQIDRG